MPDPTWTLGVETSCDDTSAALLKDGFSVRSNVVSSQTEIHAEYGGVVPELASRAHVTNIRPVVSAALDRAGVKWGDVGLVAVTRGPGLVGSLLVGVNFAKAAAFSRGIPVVGVNHLEGHFYSPLIEQGDVAFPVLALVVSGGHTSLYFSRSEFRHGLLACTRDDAAGEAFDKAAKTLGLPYPGGPAIDRVARGYDGEGVRFNMPKISDGSMDFSFSGLKTALLMRAEKLSDRGADHWRDGSPTEEVQALLKGFQQAVVRQLLDRVRAFANRLRPATVLLGGGVACNSLLRQEIVRFGEKSGTPVRVPSPAYSTDNAAMIALAGHRRFLHDGPSPPDFNAEASLPLEGEENCPAPLPQA